MQDVLWIGFYHDFGGKISHCFTNRLLQMMKYL